MPQLSILQIKGIYGESLCWLKSNKCLIMRQKENYKM